MCLIGAITRLTESGLSITRWEPIKGIIPPLTPDDWAQAFARYRQTPQYRAINQGMDLPAFKNIFFWEWLHRLWGRLIGVVYALPLGLFWLRRRIPPQFKRPLLVGLGLGGLQGFVGWFMVQSGLVEGMVSVNHFRLALHLGMALGIYAYLFWQILRLRQTSPAMANTSQKLHPHAWLALAMLSLTMVWGAFTAGLRAGKIYNSFPNMGNTLIPPDLLAGNFFSNPAAVQFTHRWLAISSFCVLVALAVRLYHAGSKKLAVWLGFCTTLQVTLGIITLLTVTALFPATLHQANAIITLTLLLACLKATASRPLAALRFPQPNAAG